MGGGMVTAPPPPMGGGMMGGAGNLFGGGGMDLFNISSGPTGGVAGVYTAPKEVSKKERGRERERIIE